MGQWATVDDVLSRWVGEDQPSDLGLVGWIIEDAETVIAAEFPGIAERIGGGDLPVERIRLVVARMVTRALRNPEGVRTRQEGTGPFTGSVTFGGDNPGDLWLTDDEMGLLRPSGRHRQRAFTINTISTPEPGPPWWVTP